MNQWFKWMLAIAAGLFLAQLLWLLIEMLVAWISSQVNPCELKFY